MMIDKKYQGKGFKQKPELKVIKLTKTNPKIKTIKAYYVKGNKAMKHILTKIGFGQITKKNPKFSMSTKYGKF